MSAENSKIIRYFNQKIADIIPIVGHYNPTTLITKNGDLIQIIEIRGFIQKELSNSGKVLRDEVRSAIKEYVEDLDIAVYLHVIRDYDSIMPKKYEGTEQIVKLVEDAWCKKHRWDYQLTNTLYITIIKRGPKTHFLDIPNFFISILPFALKQKYKKHFLKSVEALDKITQNIQNHLAIFASKVLSVVKEGENFYSEPLSFYYYLTHLKKERIKLEKYDFGELLSDFQISSDFNTLLLMYNKVIKHVALYTVELASEIEVEVLDIILQSNSQFIISEFLTFVSAEQALMKIKKYNDILKSMKNSDIAKELYIDKILNFDQGLSTDFCSSQINVLVHSDSDDDLQEKIEDIANRFNALGLKTVREDINLQTVFFTNLPGNTFYNNRVNYLPTLHAAAFSMIHSKKMGNYNGSKWGVPVTILKTLRGGYYNFNFHYHDNGNTIIIGPYGTRKTTLTHFLLAQSLKFDINIVYIDLEERSSKFINAINGTIFELLENQESPIQIDLLDIANYDGDADWMADLLLKICAKDDLYRYNNKGYIAKFKELAGELANMKNFDEKTKYMENFIKQFNDLTIKTNYKNFFKSDFLVNFFRKMFLIFSMNINT